MNRYLRIYALFFGILAGTLTNTAMTWAAGQPLTAEEKEEIEVKKQEKLHDRQVTGIVAGVVAVFVVSAVFWVLNNFNKVKKYYTLLERRQAPAEEELPIIPIQPMSSEPPAGEW